jgi:hypothetical protein
MKRRAEDELEQESAKRKRESIPPGPVFPNEILESFWLHLKTNGDPTIVSFALTSKYFLSFLVCFFLFLASSLLHPLLIS